MKKLVLLSAALLFSNMLKAQIDTLDHLIPFFKDYASWFTEEFNEDEQVWFYDDNANDFNATNSKVSLNNQLHTYSLATGDFNNDSYPDIVFGNFADYHNGGSADEEIWYFDPGTGGFNKTILSNSDGYTRSIKVADFNNDGIDDFVTGNLGDEFVFLSNGSSFDKIVLSSGGFTEDLEIADFNKDGYLDIAIGNSKHPNNTTPEDEQVWFYDGINNFTQSTLVGSAGTTMALSSMVLNGNTYLLIANDLDEDDAYWVYSNNNWYKKTIDK